MIGGIALFIILTFTTILVIRANAPHCPADFKKGPCDVGVVCSKETNFIPQSTGKIPGCDEEIEFAKMQCAGKVGVLVKEYDVNTQECLTDVDPKTAIVPYTSTERVGDSSAKFRITTSLSQPFNLNADEVVTDIVAEQLLAADLKITHIELDGTDENKQLLVLGEQNLDKAIAAIQTPVKVRLRINNIPGIKESGKTTSLKLLIDTKYVAGTGTSATQKTGRLTVNLKNLNFAWLRPTAHYACPDAAKCNDNDASTRDFCDAADAPFCKHEPIAGACGNGVCEASENKCTCAKDCGVCQGTGKVTSSQCIENQCRVTLRPEVIIQPIKTTTQNSPSKVSVTTSLEFNSPFNAKEDKVTVSIAVDEMDATVTSFTIDKILLLKGTVELASQELNKNLGVGQTATAVLPLTTLLADEDFTPQVKIFYTTTAKTTDQNSYSVTMQKVTVYNPG